MEPRREPQHAPVSQSVSQSVGQQVSISSAQGGPGKVWHGGSGVVLFLCMRVHCKQCKVQMPQVLGGCCVYCLGPAAY
jgi:hypothetical protein